MKDVLFKVVPACFLIGASMELFMLKTGFYDIVGRKASERLTSQREEEERIKQKMAKLNISFDDVQSNKKSET